jgi:hypothetical protein
LFPGPSVIRFVAAQLFDRLVVLDQDLGERALLQDGRLGLETAIDAEIGKGDLPD